MRANLHTYRLAVKVPAKLALLSPNDLDGYVRQHWSDWQDRWEPVGTLDASDAVLRIDPGQPMYLVARGRTHYQIASATRAMYDTAAWADWRCLRR